LPLSQHEQQLCRKNYSLVRVVNGKVDGFIRNNRIEQINEKEKVRVGIEIIIIIIDHNLGCVSMVSDKNEIQS